MHNIPGRRISRRLLRRALRSACAERSKVRDDLVKEIRNVNAATALSFGIVNGMLELKKQHVAQLKSSHNDDLQRHQEYMAKRETGEIQGNAPYAL